jgi:hypothetical protein
VSVPALFKQVSLLRRDLAGGAGCGPGCPPRRFAVDFDDWLGTGPSRGETSGPAACPRCGRPAEVTSVAVECDTDFHGHAERLAGLAAGAGGA